MCLCVRGLFVFKRTLACFQLPLFLFCPGCAIFYFPLQFDQLPVQFPGSGCQAGQLKCQGGRLQAGDIRSLGSFLPGRSGQAERFVLLHHLAGARLVVAGKLFAYSFNAFTVIEKIPDFLNQGIGAGFDQPTGFTVGNSFFKAADTGSKHRDIQFLHF